MQIHVEIIEGQSTKKHFLKLISFVFCWSIIDLETKGTNKTRQFTTHKTALINSINFTNAFSYTIVQI